ncbi:MAG: hypothetical protein IIA60_02560 [Candidatus Marinimicrobia bacterium]|nr:hypothetical protein [Candidatus Neomarinimicrobiota bacterium]
MKRLFIMFQMVAAVVLGAQDIISVGVRGISDANRDGVQKDRLEAIMDAKRQACEKAGISIESTTTVENFQMVYDLVESQAAAVLLPGFQIIDNGYGEDGTYSVVLIGQVKTATAASSDQARFTIIVWFYESEDALEQSYQLLDQLYKWLLRAYGEFTLDGSSIEDWEDQLVAVSRSDSLIADRRFYAFSYQLPAGTVQYTQELADYPDKVQKIRLRPNRSYIMEVAAWNGIYFKDPVEFSGTGINQRSYGTYPGDFRPVYEKE